MEIFITILNFLILGMIIAIPIILLIVLKKFNIKYYFIYYFLIGLFLLGVVSYFFAWWADKSDMMLLEYYGFNFDAMNDTERYGNVLPENMERVKSIEISIMGIGWTLKAIFGFVIFLPYLLFVFIGDKLLQLIRYSVKRNRTEDSIQK